MLKRLTTKEFIEKAKDFHKDKYDYSKTHYLNTHTKVCIICLEHGEFWQTPNHHLKYGCSKCGRKVASKKLVSNSEEFIKKSITIHGNKYDYSKVEYQRWNKKVIIICKEHGEFKQIPNSHLNGNGCPNCIYSKGEELIVEILNQNCIHFQREYSFPELLSDNNVPLRFDFRLENGTLIEYDGGQHFKPVSYFGGDESFKKLKKYDEMKNKFCEINCLKLIRIPFTMNEGKIKKVLENEAC